MCYSASASFTSAVVLVTAGSFTLAKALRQNRSFWAFSVLPIVFGLQQALEGGVWWALGAADSAMPRWPVLGFVFFSHFFWPMWVPFSCYVSEVRQSRKQLFLLMTTVGALFGATLYLPFLRQDHWLMASVISHSIEYQTILLYDDFVPRFVLTGIYMLIVLMPLLLSSDRYHKVLGALVMLSAIITLLFFDFVFISVWCYFAAIISLYIYFVTISGARLPRFVPG